MAKYFPPDPSEISDEALCQMALAGQRSCEDDLVMRYTWLVRRISRPLFLIGGDQEDLIQEGMIGLTNAIHKFDPERGVSFRLFADRCIRNRLSSAIRDAANQKHQPLNDALSLDAEEPQALPLRQADPEDLLLDEVAFQESLKRCEKALSSRENRVLDLYLQGFSRQEMAHRLSFSVKSVDNTLQRIRQKLRTLFYR